MLSGALVAVVYAVLLMLGGLSAASFVLGFKLAQT
jgi:uncharacterized membrane protein